MYTNTQNLSNFHIYLQREWPDSPPSGPRNAPKKPEKPEPRSKLPEKVWGWFSIGNIETWFALNVLDNYTDIVPGRDDIWKEVIHLIFKKGVTADHGSADGKKTRFENGSRVTIDSTTLSITASELQGGFASPALLMITNKDWTKEHLHIYPPGIPVPAESDKK